MSTVCTSPARGQSHWVPPAVQVSTVCVYESWDEVQQLAEAWNELQAQTPDSTFFHTWEFFQCLWRHFGHRRQLQVLAYLRAGEVRGILPLVIQRVRTRLGWMRFLTFPLDDWGSFYSPLGPNICQTLQACLEVALHHKSQPWEVFELRWVDLEGESGRAILQAVQELGLPAVVRTREHAAWIHLEQSWAEFLRRRPRWKKSFRQSLNRLRRQGQVQLVRHRPLPEEPLRWEPLEDAMLVAARSWQAQSRVGNTLSHPRFVPFLRDLYAAAWSRGELDLALLYLDHMPVAFFFNLIRSGRLYGLRTGYDQQLRRFGPGVVTLGLLLQQSIERGDRWVDMGSELYPYKKQLADQLRPVGSITLACRGGLRSRVYALKQFGFRLRSSTTPAQKAAEP